MASTTIKGNYLTTGMLTLSGPMSTLDWGHMTYAKYGRLAIISFYAVTISASVSAGTAVVTLPFHVKNWHGQVVTSTEGNKAFLFTQDGQNQIYLEGGAPTGGTYYFDFVVATSS